MEHMLPATDGATLTSNAYFSGTMDPVSSASSGCNFGGVPMPGGGDPSTTGGLSGTADTYTSNFPLLALMVSSSVAIYKQQ